jgi:ketosteroid isomerase-like protein
MGVPAAGKETHADGVSALRFQGGKIVEQRDYWDAATLLRQLGALKQ